MNVGIFIGDSMDWSKFNLLIPDEIIEVGDATTVYRYASVRIN